MTKIRRLILAGALFFPPCLPHRVVAEEQPPFVLEDAKANYNDIEAYRLIDQHTHDDVDSQRIPRMDAAPRTNVTPRFEGDFIYNSTGKQLCYSTGTLSTQWAVAGSSTTACAN